MSKNNYTKLTGNMGSEARVKEEKGKKMAAFSLATTDSYKDEKQVWQNKETMCHNILAFNPRIVKIIEGMKKGTRITVEGTLAYRPFQTVIEEGKEVTKNETSIIIEKVEPAPLWKKSNPTEEDQGAVQTSLEISSSIEEPS